MIIIQEYDPNWAISFQTLATIIRRATWQNILIEHVGSTSVTGLPAKPIIDMDVIVSRCKIKTTIQMLKSLGYEHRGDLGIKGREAFYSPQKIYIDHHLYLCVEGGTAVRNHLFLRDYLRSNPKQKYRYGDLKRKLAQKFATDIDSYIEGKTSFITEILQLCGMTDMELSSIVNVNEKKPQTNSSR